MYQNNNYNISRILQEAKTKIESDFRERQNAINQEYQMRMQSLMSDMTNGYTQQFQPQQPQPMQVNSEIQNAFMRSNEYQQTFNSLFNQFMQQQFFGQFQNSQFYAEFKKFADNAYPAFEKKWIANAQQAEIIEDEVKPKKVKANEASKNGSTE